MTVLRLEDKNVGGLAARFQREHVNLFVLATIN